jgi:serine/threonine-protein kinase
MAQAAPAAASAPSDPRLTDTALLASIERRLAEYMGPIAGRMVRTTARDAASAEALCERLSESIDAPAERARFLADVGKRLQGVASLSGSLPPTGPTLPEAEIERVQQDLARYIGPMAKVLVRRAAATATSTTALRESVAQHLEQPAERTAFLAGR